MFAKLLLIILSAAVTGIALLVLRHQRIDEAHAMSRAHQRALEQERALWKLRTEIAERCQPAEIRSLVIDDEDAWQSIPVPSDAAPPVVIPAGTALRSTLPGPMQRPGETPAPSEIVQNEESRSDGNAG
jgi:hypothetical protein